MSSVAWEATSTARNQKKLACSSRLSWHHGAVGERRVKSCRDTTGCRQPTCTLGTHFPSLYPPHSFQPVRWSALTLSNAAAYFSFLLNSSIPQSISRQNNRGFSISSAPLNSPLTLLRYLSPARVSVLPTLMRTSETRSGSAS